MISDNYAFLEKTGWGGMFGGFFAFVSVFIINMSAKKRGQGYMICLDLFLVIVTVLI